MSAVELRSGISMSEKKERCCCWANWVIWRRKTYMSSFNSRSTWRRTYRLSTNYFTIDCRAGKISTKETIDSQKKGKSCWRITLESIQERGRMELLIELLLLWTRRKCEFHIRNTISRCARVSLHLTGWNLSSFGMQVWKEKYFSIVCHSPSLPPKMGWSWSVYEYFSFYGNSNSHVHVSIRDVGLSIVTFSGCWNELILDLKLNAATCMCTTTARKWIRIETKWKKSFKESTLEFRIEIK